MKNDSTRFLIKDRDVNIADHYYGKSHISTTFIVQRASNVRAHKKDQSLRRLAGQMKYFLYARLQFGISPRDHETVRTEGSEVLILNYPFFDLTFRPLHQM